MSGSSAAHPPLPLDPAAVETRIAQNVPDTLRRFARNYRDELDAADARIVLNSNLVEIEVGEQADLVSGLRLRTLTGVDFRATARRYVLAAGGVENPRLLLASTGRFPAGVGNGEDLVGRYFLEHPRFIGGTFVPFDPELDLRLYQTHDAGDSRITGYLSLPEAVRDVRGNLGRPVSAGAPLSAVLQPCHRRRGSRRTATPDGSR